MRGAQRQFAEKAGIFFQAEGLPRIAGRIFGLLLLEESPRSIDQIAAALLVSKPSVSTNARILERWGYLERVGRPGDRRSYYRISPDLPERSLHLRVERMRRFSTLMEDARARAPRGRPRLRERLTELVTAYEQTLVAMVRIKEEWERRSLTRPPT